VGPLVGELVGELVAANTFCAPAFTDCTAALAAFEKKSEPSEDSTLVPRRPLMAFVTNAAAVVLSKRCINARWVASALASTRPLDVSTAGADSEAKSWPSWRSPSPSTPRRWENVSAAAVAYQEQRKEH
jgi:hypothetical protein